jgi:hypothetical protein
MLLTNQKTINYENLYKTQGNHPSCFVSTNVQVFFEFYLIKNQL